MRTEHRVEDRWDHRTAYQHLFPDYEDDAGHFMGSATGVGVTLRNRLAEAQNWRCCYCGQVMNRWRPGPSLCTIEHLIPASAGGRVCWETCAAACHRCNTEGGKLLYQEWLLPLTPLLCPRCGGDSVNILGRKALRCRQCCQQFSLETTNGMPFTRPVFACLRRAAGEIIVHDADVNRIADRIKRMIKLSFQPRVFAEVMARWAAPAVARARERSADLVEIYDLAVADLKRDYTPKTHAAPERGPPCGLVTG